MRLSLNFLMFVVAVAAGVYLGWDKIVPHLPFKIVAADEAVEEPAAKGKEAPAGEASAAGVATVDVDAEDGEATVASVSGKKDTPRVSKPGEVLLEATQAGVKGLLVISLTETKNAGVASQMNAVAVPARRGSESRVRFNQDVGEDMENALEEVVKFHKIRHGGWPTGHEIEIAFEDKYSDKDGPSAAVACALMIESLITGAKLDEGFAVTGDLNADGAVQPVGGAAAKLRGASKKNCNVVAVPSENAKYVRDLFILDGAGVLTAIQVFTIEDFDEAIALALEDRSEAVAESVREFASVQEVFSKRGANPVALMNNAKVQEKLEAILENTPNHLSARIMLDAGRGTLSKRLSLYGSLTAIDGAVADVLRVVNDQTKALGRLGGDDITRSLYELKKIERKLDSRTMAYCAAINDLGRSCRTWIIDPPENSNLQDQLIDEIKRNAERVGDEIDRLNKDPEVVEELLE